MWCQFSEKQKLRNLFESLAKLGIQRLSRFCFINLFVSLFGPPCLLLLVIRYMFLVNKIDDSWVFICNHIQCTVTQRFDLRACSKHSNRINLSHKSCIGIYQQLLKSIRSFIFFNMLNVKVKESNSFCSSLEYREYTYNLSYLHPWILWYSSFIFSPQKSPR